MAARPAVVLVLVNPQDIVNIASAVRIARNFGIERMRLVQPEVFDPWRIEGIAHNSAEFVRRIEIVETLEAALADCVSSFVLTGRERAAKRRTLRPREAAAELVRDLAQGPVAIVAGREDSGLTNAELDLCRTVVTIATDPRHPSLNLAQAVAIASIPEDIRGFGHVKERNLQAAKRKEAELLAAFHAGDTAPRAA